MPSLFPNVGEIRISLNDQTMRTVLCYVTLLGIGTKSTEYQTMKWGISQDTAPKPTINGVLNH